MAKKLTFKSHSVRNGIEAANAAVGAAAALKKFQKVIANRVQLWDETLHGLRTSQVSSQVMS